MIFVEDYLYIVWRLSVYCLRLSVYWLEIIFVADYLYIDWRLSVYCLRLSVYWLEIIFTLFEMICVLVGDYLCTGWNSGILCTV
jgi:hypothetical protein